MSKACANWQNGSGNSLTFSDVLNNIFYYISDDNPLNIGIQNFSIVVGCDSQRHKEMDYKFSTTICIRRMIDESHGRGGIYFVQNTWEKIRGNHCSKLVLSTKLIEEACKTVTVAKELSDELLKLCLEKEINLIDKIEISMHFDVSQSGGSNIAIGAVKGLAHGTGIDFCIKPYSWCASSLSNRHSK